MAAISLKKRVIISVLLALVIYFIGDWLPYSESVSMTYLAAIIGGGAFWIGSRP